jgi:NAD(P)-dependent dehydrogenase (short-subunit alcohol dehydrogenase family)
MGFDIELGASVARVSSYKSCQQLPFMQSTPESNYYYEKRNKPSEWGDDSAIGASVASVSEYESYQQLLPLKRSSLEPDYSYEEARKPSIEKKAKWNFGGKLDICVTCAGINKNVPFLETSFEDHQRLISVNVMGVFHTAQLAAKLMIKNGTTKGSIIMIASIASCTTATYSLSKIYKLKLACYTYS